MNSRQEGGHSRENPYRLLNGLVGGLVGELHRETGEAFNTCLLNSASVDLSNYRPGFQTPLQGNFIVNDDRWGWNQELILTGPKDSDHPSAAYHFQREEDSMRTFFPDTPFPLYGFSLVQVTHRKDHKINGSMLFLATTFALSKGRNLVSIVQRIWDVSDRGRYINFFLNLDFCLNFGIVSPHELEIQELSRLQKLIDVLENDIDFRHRMTIIDNARNNRYLLEGVGQPSERIPLSEVAEIIRSK